MRVTAFQETNSCLIVAGRVCAGRAGIACLQTARSLPSKKSTGGNPLSKGFTLIEIVVTIVIVGIIGGIAAMIIAQGVRAYSDEQSRSDVHYQARFAMERMAREIRTIRSRADVTMMLNNDLQFVDISGNTVRFNLAGTDIQRSGTVLASNISALAFTYYQDSGAVAPSAATLWTIEISLTAIQGAEVMQVRTRVHPRNF